MATRNDGVLISTEMRSEGGPDLDLPLPNRRTIRQVDSADLAAGGVDYFESDSLGFCNPPGVAEQRPIPVLAIGGSIPNCAAVAKENNFTVWLGRELQATSYNMAAPGVGPYDYLEILRRFGAPLNPAVVIMAISQNDELVDIRKYHAFLARERGFGPLVVMVPSAHTDYARTITYSDPAICAIIPRAAETNSKSLAKTAADLGVAAFPQRRALHTGRAQGAG